MVGFWSGILNRQKTKIQKTCQRYSHEILCFPYREPFTWLRYYAGEKMKFGEGRIETSSLKDILFHWMFHFCCKYVPPALNCGEQAVRRQMYVVEGWKLTLLKNIVNKSANVLNSFVEN